MLRLFLKYWFFVGLGVVVMVALAVPASGVVLREWGLVSGSVWLAFLIVGLTLKTHSLFLQAKALKPLLAAAGSSLVLMPFLAWSLAGAVFGRQTDFAVGVVIMMVAPVTVASGTVMTALACGNVALSLLICVTGNALALLTIPLLLPVLSGSSIAVDLPVGSMAVDLLRMVLVPTVLGQLLRPFLVNLINAHRGALSVFSQGVVLLIVFNALSSSASRLASVGPALTWLAVFMGGLHGLFLALNYGLARVLRLDQGSVAAFTIHVSQKTLTVSYVVWAGYFSEHYPLAMLPGILYHVTQTIAGIGVARAFRRQTERRMNDRPARMRITTTNGVKR